MKSKTLKECQKLLTYLLKHKDSGPFREPVDWKAWKLLDYPSIIKHPMDLGTVEKKLSSNSFESALDFAADCRLVWSNCKTYNQDGSEYFKLATKFSRLFEQKLGKIDLSEDFGVVKPPTQEEKKQFCRNIYEIESEALGQVVLMLDERCEKCLDKSDPDEIEINIEEIDPHTFRDVDKFIKECVAGESKKKKRKL